MPHGFNENTQVVYFEQQRPRSYRAHFYLLEGRASLTVPYTFFYSLRETQDQGITEEKNHSDRIWEHWKHTLRHMHNAGVRKTEEILPCSLSAAMTWAEMI